MKYSLTEILNKKLLWGTLVSVLMSACSGKKEPKAVDNLYVYSQYAEANNPNMKANTAWNGVPEYLSGSFGSTDYRYSKHEPPLMDNKKKWEGTAWKGERVSAQIVVWSSEDVGDISFKAYALKNETGTSIKESQIRMRFVRYVLTDEFAGGCGYRDPQDFAVSLVPDAIDEVDELALEPKTTRPIWVTIDVPGDVQDGLYQGKLVVTSQRGGELDFMISLNVQRQVLPPSSDWAYHLDLWQNPYAVARYHKVPEWSTEHFKLMKPLFGMLADAGQKCITTSIIEKPWNGQSEDPFKSMIQWTKNEDGSWSFDYSIFDKWVSFAQECGITEQINCYTMVPWEMNFTYFDKNKNSIDTLHAQSGTEAYEELWRPFLRDFTKHLKSKKWFNKTTIAMDERPVKDMQAVIQLIKGVSPELKITLAGGFHKELAGDIYDLCVASRHDIPKEEMDKRDSLNMPTTYYTCCTEPYPNNFTFSPPAEGTWQGWHAAAKGYSGYLRWAYNSWVKDPLLDSRFQAWPAGDTYLVYPQARTSIRFERMREGIQDYEKIRILSEQLKKTEDEELWQQLTAKLNGFEISALETKKASEMVNDGKRLIHRLSDEIQMKR